MARTRAEDYEAKRALIFERAAELFARQGFDRTSIAEIATECRASKSWIYHYFSSKETILHEILRDHMHLLLATAEDALVAHRRPDQQLRALLGALMAIYARAQAKHVVLLNELDRLPPAQKAEIQDLQRRLVGLVQSLLQGVNPSLAQRRNLARPITMMLFGMINWTYTWYDADGALKPDQLAALAASLFLHGLESFAGEKRLAV